MHTRQEGFLVADSWSLPRTACQLSALCYSAWLQGAQLASWGARWSHHVSLLMMFCSGLRFPSSRSAAFFPAFPLEGATHKAIHRVSEEWPEPHDHVGSCGQVLAFSGSVPAAEKKRCFRREVFSAKVLVFRLLMACWSLLARSKASRTHRGFASLREIRALTGPPWTVNLWVVPNLRVTRSLVQGCCGLAVPKASPCQTSTHTMQQTQAVLLG